MRGFFFGGARPRGCRAPRLPPPRARTSRSSSQAAPRPKRSASPPAPQREPGRRRRGASVGASPPVPAPSVARRCRRRRRARAAWAAALSSNDGMSHSRRSATWRYRRPAAPSAGSRMRHHGGDRLAGRVAAGHVVSSGDGHRGGRARAAPAAAQPRWAAAVAAPPKPAPSRPRRRRSGATRERMGAEATGLGGITWARRRRPARRPILQSGADGAQEQRADARRRGGLGAGAGDATGSNISRREGGCGCCGARRGGRAAWSWPCACSLLALLCSTDARRAPSRAERRASASSTAAAACRAVGPAPSSRDRLAAAATAVQNSAAQPAAAGGRGSRRRNCWRGLWQGYRRPARRARTRDARRRRRPRRSRGCSRQAGGGGGGGGEAVAATTVSRNCARRCARGRRQRRPQLTQAEAAELEMLRARAQQHAARPHWDKDKTKVGIREITQMNIRTRTYRDSDASAWAWYPSYPRCPWHLTAHGTVLYKYLQYLVPKYTSTAARRRDACRPVAWSTVRPAGLQSERWIAPAGFSSTNISEYQEHVLQTRCAGAGEGRTPPVLAPDRLPAIAPRAGHRTPGCCRRSEESCSPTCSAASATTCRPSGTSCIRMERVKKLVRLRPRSCHATAAPASDASPCAACRRSARRQAVLRNGCRPRRRAAALRTRRARCGGRRRAAVPAGGAYLHGAFRVALTLHHVGSAFPTVLMQQNVSADALVPYPPRSASCRRCRWSRRWRARGETSGWRRRL